MRHGELAVSSPSAATQPATVSRRIALNQAIGRAPNVAELVGNPVRQILHGGVISAALDVVGGLAIALASYAAKPEPIASYVPNPPAELVTIVDKALAKTREERYQSAAEMSAALRSLAQTL